MALQRRAACAEPVSTRRHCGVVHDVVAAVFGVKMPEIATRRQCRSTQHVVAAKEGRMRPQNGNPATFFILWKYLSSPYLKAEWRDFINSLIFSRLQADYRALNYVVLDFFLKHHPATL